MARMSFWESAQFSYSRARWGFWASWKFLISSFTVPKKFAYAGPAVLNTLNRVVRTPSSPAIESLARIQLPRKNTLSYGASMR